MQFTDRTPEVAASRRRGLPASSQVPAEGLAVMAQERLPFTIRIASTEADLRKVVHIRHAAYARHVPALAAALSLAEPTDYEPGVTLLVAESKLDGSPLGTMRIQTNRFRELSIQQSMELPEWLRGRHLAEATRLGVEQGRTGTLVKTVLFKAFYHYCLQQGVDWMVITARKPIDRQYENLLFVDAVPGAGFVPMKHVGNLPHRVLCLDVKQAASRWEAAEHPLLAYMTTTRHPDIDLQAQPAQFRTPADAPVRPSMPSAMQPRGLAASG